MKRTILIAGSLAQKPGEGGHTWVFLQYLHGFRRLGYDVLFLDRLEPEMCVDEAGQRCPLEQSVNLRYFLDVMTSAGLSDSFALIYNRERFIGLDRQQVLERAASCVFLLNVMGFLDDAEILNYISHKVFLDIDPGFGQMWKELGWSDIFRGHDAFVTVGQNIGHADCEIPTCGLSWITTPQPVVLERWPVVADRGEAFTSIASWRGIFAPIEYRDKTYGLRVHEFRKFFELPRRTGLPFHLALDIHPNEVKDLEQLHANGWKLLNPRAVAGSPSAYQSFIQSSRAEFMVAKNAYVQSRSAWVSDRSICYLASGKPVLAQDTGLAHLYPTREGLVIFTTLDEVVDGAARIQRDYARHCAAARAIGKEFFDSDKVLARLLAQLQVE